MKACIEAAHLEDPNGLMAPRMTIRVDYRGTPVQVKVSSVLAESELRLSSLLKHYAVENDVLTAFIFEEHLVDKSKKAILSDIDRELLL